MKLLALDSATELCSAALSIDGQVSVREAPRARGSGELILPMIEQLLSQADLELSPARRDRIRARPGRLHRRAPGRRRRPGTGIRAGLPLLPVSDLRALAAQALRLPGAAHARLICQDARMEEGYWG